jgi:3-demethoxyubiquinol 3-hydroxylase
VSTRSLSPTDHLLGEIGKAINVLGGPARAARALPGASTLGASTLGASTLGASTLGASTGEGVLDEADRRRSARLMRVNHAGEVAAQALYRGQALTARNAEAATVMSQAAAEEIDHLAWCEQRIAELGGRVSVLNPLWYAGSFLIGSLAGALGDRTSLGFLSETERQVESHLQDHLDRLPATDGRSRAIVEQMQHDEIAHGAKAETLGAAALPGWVKAAMRLTSRLMTRGSYWL